MRRGAASWPRRIGDGSTGHGGASRGEAPFLRPAVWDGQAKVYASQSDIRGLRIEAETLEAFEEVLADVAPDLIGANHLSKADSASTSRTDLIPTIVWERPAPRNAGSKTRL